MDWASRNSSIRSPSSPLPKPVAADVTTREGQATLLAALPGRPL